MRVQPALARITSRDGGPVHRAWVWRRATTCQRTRRLIQMANTIQSKKRARQNQKRLAVNKARRSRIRTYLRQVEEAIASGDQTAAADALKAAQPELMRGVSKGVFHKNTASRKMSRLASRIKTLG